MIYNALFIALCYAPIFETANKVIVASIVNESIHAYNSAFIIVGHVQSGNLHIPEIITNFIKKLFIIPITMSFKNTTALTTHFKPYKSVFMSVMYFYAFVILCIGKTISPTIARDPRSIFKADKLFYEQRIMYFTCN